MAVNLNAVMKHNGSITPTAALLDGAADPGSLYGGTSPRFATAGKPAGRYGMRVTYPSALDLSAHDYVSLGYVAESWGPAYGLASVGSGGLRVLFVDSGGNYAGYNLYGGDVPGYTPDNTQGYLAAYAYERFTFHIARGRTPNVASGVIDWSAIVALELSLYKTSGDNKDAGIMYVVSRSAPIVTGSSGFSAIAVAAMSSWDKQLISQSPVMQRNAAQSLYSLAIGLTVGNGVTATNLTDSGFGVGFENPYEFSASYPTSGPWVQLPDSHARALKIVQSAACVLSLTDGSFASAGWWQWELSGTGVATCTRVDFWRFDGFTAAHGSYIDCAWNEADTAVEVTAATVITGGVIRGAKTTALKVLSGAGVYSGLDLEINSPAATYDIELGDGGAGAYELAKITVPAGYTLRLRNNSSSNAITVKLPLGLAYSTSTAGGAITVTIPEVSVDISAPALIAGSRVQLYSVTDGVQLLNTVLVGTGLTHTLPYVADKVIRLRADHATKLPLETIGVLTATGLTFLDVQEEDKVYLTNSIDGSTVTEFVPDLPNIQVDINDPDGVTYVQRLYAWFQWYMTTAEGIASDFFGAVYAIDSTNYIIDQSKADIRLDNVSLMPVMVTGATLTRKDGTTILAPTTNAIQIDPGRSYSVETGVSGLTPTEAVKLDAISSLALETTAQSIVASVVALLARPQPPTASDVSTSVWGSESAALVSKEATSQQLITKTNGIQTGVTTLVGRSEAPTTAQITTAVWGSPTVSSLAKEVSSQSILTLSNTSDTKLNNLLAKPNAPTTAEIATSVWSASKVNTLALEASLAPIAATSTTAATNTTALVSRATPPTKEEVAVSVWGYTE